MSMQANLHLPADLPLDEVRAKKAHTWMTEANPDGVTLYDESWSAGVGYPGASIGDDVPADLANVWAAIDIHGPQGIVSVSIHGDLDQLDALAWAIHTNVMQIRAALSEARANAARLAEQAQTNPDIAANLAVKAAQDEAQARGRDIAINTATQAAQMGLSS